MNIYLIKRTDDYMRWDQNFGHVVVAINENRAREVCAKKSDGEGPDIWHAKSTKVIKINNVVFDTEQIILTDFRVG